MKLILFKGITVFKINHKRSTKNIELKKYPSLLDGVWLTN